MSYQETEQTKLRRQSSKEAIDLAMQGRWREAEICQATFRAK